MKADPSLWCTSDLRQRQDGPSGVRLQIEPLARGPPAMAPTRHTPMPLRRTKRLDAQQSSSKHVRKSRNRPDILAIVNTWSPRMQLGRRTEAADQNLTAEQVGDPNTEAAGAYALSSDDRVFCTRVELERCVAIIIGSHVNGPDLTAPLSSDAALKASRAQSYSHCDRAAPRCQSGQRTRAWARSHLGR